MGNFIILLKFEVYRHCFGHLWGKLSQLIFWELNYHWSGSLRKLSGHYPIFYEARANSMYFGAFHQIFKLGLMPCLQMNDLALFDSIKSLD